MIDIKKYQNDGWSLSEKCLLDILNIIKTFDEEEINIVEFGSGISTLFLVDLIKEGYNLNITSFDNDIRYAAKVEHPKLKLYIAELVDCYDSDFTNQFIEKKYNKSFFSKLLYEPHTRQKNVFYDINENQLPEKIDILIVDGPHGNGRSIAFLHSINHLKTNSYVVIDDYNHYDFVSDFNKIFPNNIIVSEPHNSIGNKGNLDENYIVFKLK